MTGLLGGSIASGMMLAVMMANAGGAWSPIGDVTTTMLWIGKQVTTGKLMEYVFLPSLVCLIVPLLFVMPKLKGDLMPIAVDFTFLSSIAASPS